MVVGLQAEVFYLGPPRHKAGKLPTWNHNMQWYRRRVHFFIDCAIWSRNFSSMRDI